VVSDNFSTDETQEMMRELVTKIPRLVYHRQPQPVSIAFNWHTAITKASGRYAFAVADDDVCIEDQLAAAVEALETDPSLLCVYGGYYEVDMQDNIRHIHRKTERNLFFAKADKLALVNQFFSFEIPIFRLDFYKSVTIFSDKTFVLSWDFVGACLNAGQILVAPLLLIRHTIHPNRLTETKAADPAFNFSWMSSFETFLAGTDCDQGTRLSTLVNLFAKMNFFHASVCMRNGMALDARLFILKGMSYAPTDFHKLALEWESGQIALAAVELLASTLTDSHPPRIVWIRDDIPIGIVKAIEERAKVVREEPPHTTPTTVLTRDVFDSVRVKGWEYFELSPALNKLMLTGRKVNVA
jgi:hypothetical protein